MSTTERESPDPPPSAPEAPDGIALPPPLPLRRKAQPLVRRRGGRGGMVVIAGPRAAPRLDLYHHAIRLPWWGFLLASSGLYIGGNFLFAGLYLLQPGSITQARPGSYSDAFFFSVQTLATIGYGVMSPATFYANMVMTAETLFGMVLLAMVTGLTFARVSVPTARVMFSRQAVITHFNGVPTLMFRIANQRSNQIVQAEVSVSLLRNERTSEGFSMRRFYDLRLARARTPIFALTFMVMHPLEADSPLYGATPESLLECEAEVVVTMTGLDATVSQQIHARTSYLAEEIRFGRRFADMFGALPDGRRVMDFTAFDETVPG